MGFWDTFLQEIMASPLETGREWEIFSNLCSLRINRTILSAALMRIHDLEALRPGKKLENLKHTMGCIEDTKRALIQTFRKDEGNPHGETIQALEMSGKQIRQAIGTLSREQGKRGRSWQTPILMALMAYFFEITNSRHCGELADLVTACYRAAGSRKTCGEESLKKLWQRNPKLRKNWRSILIKAHKFHAPSAQRAQRLLGSSGRFKPPNTSALRALGLQRHPKYLGINPLSRLR